MKIRAPKIRFSRKVLIISMGMLALLGGTGAAALYVGAADALMSPKEDNPAIGGACTTIQTMVIKTPAKRLWLRKYIRMEHADGTTRIRTALRVAGLLAKANPVDLIQVSVLDASGPTKKSDMRGRAIGAEVVIALQPKYLPDMKEPFIVRYFEGMPSDEGRYYGERVSLDLPEIRKLMGAMKDAADKQDCTEPEKPASAATEGEHGKPKEHGEAVVTVKGETPAGHGEQPADEKASAEHGAPAEEGADAAAHGEKPAKQQSFLDSMLGMVGLGGAEEKPAENHEAKAEDDSHAVADDAIEPSPASEDHAAEPGAHEEKAVPEDSGENARGHEPAKADEHGAAAEPGDAGKAHDEAKADDASHAVADDAIEPAPVADAHAAKPGASDADAADHEISVPAGEDTAAGDHEPVKADEHGAAAKPGDAGETHHEAKAEVPAAHMAETHDATPVQAAGD